MPKITGGLAAAVLAVLVLTGCAGTAPEPEPSSIATVEQDAQTSAVAPLVAETPDAESVDAMLDYIRNRMMPITQIKNATDEQLIAAAERACEQMSDGTDSTLVQVIEGERINDELEMYADSANIAGAALTFDFCD